MAVLGKELARQWVLVPENTEPTQAPFRRPV